MPKRDRSMPTCTISSSTKFQATSVPIPYLMRSLFNRSRSLPVCLIFLHFGMAILVHAEVPPLIQYQGRVVVDGVAHTGTGLFKFALVAPKPSGFDPALAPWQSDVIWQTGAGAPSAIGTWQPDAPVEITGMQGGHFSVLLGDSGQPVLSPGAFLYDDPRPEVGLVARPEVYLRVWFSADNTTYRELLPATRLASVPYAFAAGFAEDVQDGAITLNKIAAGAVTTEKIADATIAVADLSAGAQQYLIPTGTVLPWMGSGSGAVPVPPGYLLANGSTIGSGTSGSTFTGETYRALFQMLWNSTSQAAIGIQTSTGSASTRGATADADFNASKRLPLPDLRGLFLRGVNGSRADSLKDPDAAGRTGGNTVASTQLQATARNGLNNGTTKYATENHTHSSGSYFARFLILNNEQLICQDANVATSWTSTRYGTFGTNQFATLNQTVTKGSTVGGTSGVESASATVTLGAGDLETRPFNAYVNYIIKL